nr:hypothetical protein [Tanacetum cinerariifolium]
MDVKSAFLYGKIEEEVYVCQPPGFEDPDFFDKVYKVVKALYGLHQVPRAWYETLLTYLMDNSFHMGQINKTLFIKRHKDDILLVQVFVDDIIFGSTKKELSTEFETLIHDNQDKYVADILKKFSFSTVKTTSTLMEPNKALIKDAEAEDVDVHLYKLMIGSLMYLTAFRPDITFVVCVCAYLISKSGSQFRMMIEKDKRCFMDIFLVKTGISSLNTTGVTKISQFSGPINLIADEIVYKEWEDKMKRATTTTSSLEVEKDSGNINRTQFMATLNEPLPQGTSLGSGPRCQVTILGVQKLKLGLRLHLKSLMIHLSQEVLDSVKAKTDRVKWSRLSFDVPFSHDFLIGISLLTVAFDFDVPFSHDFLIGISSTHVCYPDKCLILMPKSKGVNSGWEPRGDVKMDYEENVGQSSSGPTACESGPDVSFASLLRESTRVVSERYANSAYGFFLGNRVAYSVVASHDSMLENGLWFICNNPLILKKWNPDVNLMKKDVVNILVWVKLYGVLVTTFIEDGLSAIATKIGTPLMLYSYTSDMCIKSWGSSSYTRALIEIRADVKSKDTIVVAMPKLTGEGFYTCIIHVEYEWKPPRGVCCKVFGHIQEECLKNPGGIQTKKEYRPIAKKPTANTNGNKKKGVKPTKEVSNSNPFDVLNSDVNDEEFGKVTLVDDDGKSLKKVDYPGEHDTDDENGEYDEDPYDDDMCEGQDLTDKLQDICNNLDIRVRNRRKK